MFTPQKIRRRSAPAVLAVTALALHACSSDDTTPTPSTPTAAPLSQACAAYQPTPLPHDAAFTTTELRAASGTLPEVCIVRGQIVSSAGSTIRWAVELPAKPRWNSKTLTIGGGGFDGFIPTDDPFYHELVGPAGNDFVKISSDSGHQDMGFSWGGDPMALRNHAYQANHFVLEVGTAIATEFYGHAPVKRYMFGHSNGGRSGLAAAQRFPADYDGVISLAPAINQQAHQANLGPALVQHIASSPSNWLSPAKVKLYADAELAACDSLDGVADGIISNIEACHYVPTDLLCTGADSDTCLTAGQIETVRRVYADKTVPVLFSNGLIGYPRFGRGGAATTDWNGYLFGSSFAARDSFNFFVTEAASKIISQDNNMSVMTFDPTQYQSRYTLYSSLMDSTEPDLRAFADRGGKLIIWYGLGDTCVSVYRTADYFASVQALMGQSRVATFARFFTSPGTGHGMDGPGAAKANWLQALEGWAEQNTAPDHLVASKMSSDGSRVELQRPLCPYPQFPRYKGTGDPTQADSFTCSAT